MNTNSHSRSTRFTSIRSLGRGIALSSAIAVLGVSSMSAADAAEAGVATGITHVAAQTNPAATSATSTGVQYALRDGRLVRVEK